MITRARLAGAAAALVILSHDAAAEPGLDEPARLRTPARCVTEGGSTVDLAPGRYLPEPVWNDLDAEVRRLQDVTTRLHAENRSLRASAAAGPGWTAVVAVGTALAAGILIGWQASH